ncbi:universal stress protein [Phaeocystidibacter luteus]|uniref:Universal stress protein n=1 Tax=Phaeocystidibacter luteus TaxID=911197 RepID=A0A6N6RHU1_9FLAO|nr:universal stress protein [Phaeocystidibacter luteus]KAB2809904.1 universal stress protein [Phaeocystidibacter luteus]
MSRLLVPVDFSDIAANAVEYALGLAPIFNCDVSLLHVVDDEDKTLEAERNMRSFVERFDSTGKLKTHILVGNLFEDIAKAAELLEAYTVVMGTSGLKGLQYLFGSHALRIVTHGRTPFLITQENPPKPDINTIVVPIDLSAEDKQILSLALQSARLFDAKIHLFVAHHTDEFSRNSTYRNEKFAHKYLDDHNVHYTTVHAEGKHEFSKEFLEYADLVNADLLTVVNHKEQGFLNLLGRNFDQNIITNEFKIPVLLMNAHQHKRLTDVFDVFA